MGSKLCLRLLAFVSLSYPWFTLINHLRPEWSSNPQYSYGWLVPVLCVGLLWHRPKPASAGLSTPPQPTVRSSRGLVISLFALGALLFLPIRMLLEADPTWRLTDWLLAVDVVGLTLCGLYAAGEADWLRRYAFPVGFFLVAVPWPYPVEKWLVQRLTLAASAASIEVLGIVGVPAVAHGKVIEVGTGLVGIDEACSGIRSFQSSLMISLFLGEFFGLSRWRRALLVPIGFVLAFVFNVCRTSILTWVAARKGLSAIADYHDETGVGILVVCTLTMWLLAVLLKQRERKAQQTLEKTRAASLVQLSGTRSGMLISGRMAMALSAFVVWLALVELGVGLWSHHAVTAEGRAIQWTVTWPAENPTFKRSELEKETATLLQYNDAQQGDWREVDGTRWTAFYFNWLPGRVGPYLAANRHSPEICMTSVGWEMTSGPKRVVLDIKKLHLPFRCYSFTQGPRTLHVFHCRWEPAFETNPALLDEAGLGTTLRGLRGLSVLWSGKGKGGQKILELIVEGCDTTEEAQKALVHQLNKLIKVDSQPGSALTLHRGAGPEEHLSRQSTPAATLRRSP